VTEKGAGPASQPVWEPEEYTPNEGSVGRKRIVFIGASYKFVHRVVRDMLLVGGFDECEIVVHDIDERPLRIVGDLLEKMVAQAGSGIAISRTLERGEALPGADAVILSITTGGREADFRSFEVCAKYGIPVGVGDTLGSPALARNLREIPVVVEIAADIERICPDAVVLNFTNPMSCITGAMARTTGLTVWGLCHSGDELVSYFARVFGVQKSEVQMDLSGVNHQSFVTRLLIAGEDRTADILDATQASQAKLEDQLLSTRREEVRLQQDICRLLGVWPSTGETHLAEFYEYFFTPRQSARLGLEDRLRKVRPGREPFGRTEPPEIILEWAYGDGAVGDMHLMTTEHAHELLWSAFTGDRYTRALNVLNSGEYAKGLPPDACVEVIVTTAGREVTGKQVELPAAAHSLVQRWVTIHDLSIRAALERDRAAGRQALFLDPHVTDMYDIDPMLEDLLTALEPWLPGEWFGESRGGNV
jgi:alpha-galactosidase